MKLLELFSGTHSVGKVAKELGWEVVSLDIDGDADITCDIMDWDYKNGTEPGEYDIIWASPPCHTFSRVRRSLIGRKIKFFGDQVVTAEMLDRDMEERGVPIVRRIEEIIDYFKPKYWFIENPWTGLMKNYLTHRPHYDVDYCQYADWGYKKRTRIWTNVEGFKPLICDKKCNSWNGTGHKVKLGHGNHGTCLRERYRVPPALIKSLFSCVV